MDDLIPADVNVLELTCDAHIKPNGFRVYFGSECVMFAPTEKSPAELSGVSSAMLHTLSILAETDRTLEPIADTLIDIITELRQWRNVLWHISVDALLKMQKERIAALQAELESARAATVSACKTVAAMHEAAMGETRGPNRGVVEDIADLRQANETLKTSDAFFRKAAKDALKQRDDLDAELTVARELLKTYLNAPTIEDGVVALAALNAFANDGAET